VRRRRRRGKKGEEEKISLDGGYDMVFIWCGGARIDRLGWSISMGVRHV
jgi:hypothetical protein